MALSALFGTKLLGKEGEVDTDTALAGKTVGIYFSAHWCPPCRGFTPKLAEYYSTSLKDKGLEIVFVSSDKDQEMFDDYFKDMPWLALPYSDRDKKETLSKKFKVNGIPSLIILDAAGNTITTDGRSAVMEDPTGTDFPWTPKPLAECLGAEFLKADGSKVGKDAISGKTLGIYFSAHWCPPCRGFTPQLCETYKNCKAAGKDFEVVFVSGDRDEGSFNSYFTEMAEKGGDWLAIPFGDNRKKWLNKYFNTEGIPHFAIIDADGNMIKKNARGSISEDKLGEKFPWTPPLVASLANPEGIDETLSVAVMMESSSAEAQKKAEKELEVVAKKYVDEAKAKGEDVKYLFFLARNSQGPVSRIRELCGLSGAGEGQSPTLLLLDIPDRGGFYLSDFTDITATNVEKMIADFEGKQLTRKQLGEGQ